MPLDLEELERMHREATAGPWNEIGREEPLACPAISAETHDVVEMWAGNPKVAEDRALIVHLRNHLPEIIARLKAAEEMREAVQDVLMRAQNWSGHPGAIDRLAESKMNYDAASRPISATGEVVDTDSMPDGAST